MKAFYLKAFFIMVMGFLASACSCSKPAPKDPHWQKDVCAHCGMAISDPDFAAEIVGPGFEWRFYDDIGCALSDILEKPAVTSGKLYVRPKGETAWIPAATAHYAEGFATPMNYGFAALSTGKLTLDDVRERLPRQASRRAP
jgi:hypothetical protein